MNINFSAAAFHGAPIRAKELEYIVDCIRHGHCCAVVGPSNTGKSHLMRSLPREEIRQHCFVEGGSPLLMVHIDCLEAGGSEQAFYELLLRRTIEELEFAGMSGSTLNSLRDLHREILNSTVDVAFRSIYASSVRKLGQAEDVMLVLVLDEFYDVFQHLPPWPFRQLRALYDALNTKLCYVVATSHHLEELRSGKNTYEFRELFHPYTVVLHPLTSADAQRFIHYLAAKQHEPKSLSADEISLMIELSGGHPGILERLYIMFSKSGGDLPDPLKTSPQELILERPLTKECRRLWSELELEQDALLILLEKGVWALTDHQQELLELKGLVITQKSGTVTIFSPIFKAFIEQELTGQARSVAGGLHCDFETGRIWVDNQEVTYQLSDPQRKLITFLCQNVDAISTYDEIAHGVWGIGEGVTPGAIYELVKRVRQKIEVDWKNPQYIITVAGKGYRLRKSGR